MTMQYVLITILIICFLPIYAGVISACVYLGKIAAMRSLIKESATYKKTQGE